MKRLISLSLLTLLIALYQAVWTEAAIPLPSAPGDKGSHVWQTQQRLRALGFLKAEADGVFGSETALSLYAYQAEKGIRPTGEADEETIRLLFLPPEPKKGDTLRPSWYGGGSDLIPIGARFQIKDVRTNTVFNCVRVMGVSHLDAEPLTAEDTALMLDIYGGEWSWDRRPILANYQGNVYAASMNGKPHGWEVIPGNDMSGHFCVHFFGARGDGSQRVDPEHLACAVEAGLYGWE